MRRNLMKKLIVSVITMTMVLSFSFMRTSTVQAGTDPFLGEITIFAGNYAPQGWAFCNGQLLPIAQNTALFAILGTTYGGDGINNFALPDLRGRAPVGAGIGPGLSPYTLGEMGGSETTTLLSNQNPIHNHSVGASTSQGTTNTPGTGVYLAKASTPDRQEVNIYTTVAPNTTLGVGSTGTFGNSQPFNIRQPYLTVNYIISLNGVFPPHP